MWLAVPPALVSLTCLASASENRLILIDQSDFAANKGFYLDIEAKSDGAKPITLADARLILAVADGKAWHYIVCDPRLKIGGKYAVDARISPFAATLLLDGVKAGSDSVQEVGVNKPITAGVRPDWASSPAEFVLDERTARVDGTKRTPPVRTEDWPANQAIIAYSGVRTRYTFKLDSVTGPLSCFESPLPPASKPAILEPWIDLHAEFSVLAPPGEAGYRGLIDRYGQAVAAEWPGKVKSDDDLKSTVWREYAHEIDWHQPPHLDPFGGTKTGWHEKPTGYYRLAKRNGFWWLVSPEGNPLFYRGLCTAPALKWDVTPTTGREALWKEPLPHGGLYAELWQKGVWGDSQSDVYFAPQAANLIRKFGPNWKASATQELVERLHKWGFTGEGKWSDAIPHVVSLPVLEIDAPRVGRHFDLFDPKVRAAIRESLRKQVQPQAKSPWILGWSIGNEYDEIITNDEIAAYLKLDDSHPLKKALADYLAKNGFKPDDIEAARRYYATTYYSFLYKTMKELDPNHLYFGFWIVPGWWQSEADWSLIAPYCDVIGYDRYADSYEGIENLLAKFDKPTLLGEFSFPAWYGGARAFGRYGTYVETDAESGAKYASVLRDASTDPKCIGTMWFQYRDEPITGRGPGAGPLPVYGEHYAFGMVDCTDRPKWDLVDRAREANLKATPARLKASK